MFLNPDRLVEAALARPDWAALIEATGPAVSIPGALQRLLSAQNSEDAGRAYWQLENHVVVQGQLFEAALHVVPVIMASLVDPDRPPYVRISLLELLFQIVNGESHHEEAQRGIPDLGVQCRRCATEGLWLLYRVAYDGNFDVAAEILRLIDDDPGRLALLDSSASADEPR